MSGSGLLARIYVQLRSYNYDINKPPVQSSGYTTLLLVQEVWNLISGSFKCVTASPIGPHNKGLNKDLIVFFENKL